MLYSAFEPAGRRAAGRPPGFHGHQGRGHDVENRNPFRCFDRRYLAWAAPGLVALFALAWLGHAFTRGTPARIAIGALIGAVTGYLIVLSVGTIRRLDELQRRIHLEAIAISFTFTAVLATGISFLDSAGARLPNWDFGWWPVMAFAWVAAALVLNRRYR
jgi:hypothetical protein